MKAIENKTYAVIVNSKCHNIFTSEILPEWCECGIDNVDSDSNILHNACITTMDITGLDVAENDPYDSVHGFHKPLTVWDEATSSFIPDTLALHNLLVSQANNQFGIYVNYSHGYLFSKLTTEQQTALYTYLDALQAIIKGTDTTSTTLPVIPFEI